MVADRTRREFPAFLRGTQAALSDVVRLASTAFAFVTAFTLLHSETARADDVHPRNKAAYGAGVALTVTGSVFLTTGLVAGVGGLVIAMNASGDNGGGLALLAIGGIIWGGATVVGLATLVPGIVLMAKNAPSREPVYRDARWDPPAPRFVTVPILSGTF